MWKTPFRESCYQYTEQYSHTIGESVNKNPEVITKTYGSVPCMIFTIKMIRFAVYFSIVIFSRLMFGLWIFSYSLLFRLLSIPYINVVCNTWINALISFCMKRVYTVDIFLSFLFSVSRKKMIAPLLYGGEHTTRFSYSLQWKIAGNQALHSILLLC